MDTVSIICLVLLGLILIFFIVAIIIFNTTLTRPKHYPVFGNPIAQWDRIAAQAKEGREKLLENPHETWEIKSHDGLTLRATYIPNPHAPDSKRVFLGIHSYYRNGLDEYAPYADYYFSKGFSLLLPDNRAHGASDGHVMGFGWGDRRDIVFWEKEVVKRLGEDIEILMHGISMGSAAVVCASGEADLPKQVVGMVADCGYTSALAEYACQARAMAHVPPYPVLWFLSIVCKLRAGWFLSENSPIKQIAKTHIHVLLIHGTADTFVPTRFANEFYEACPSDKELLLVPEATHAISHLVQPEMVESAISRLIDRSMTPKKPSETGEEF